MYLSLGRNAALALSTRPLCACYSQLSLSKTSSRRSAGHRDPLISTLGELGRGRILWSQVSLNDSAPVSLRSGI